MTNKHKPKPVHKTGQVEVTINPPTNAELDAVLGDNFDEIFPEEPELVIAVAALDEVTLPPEQLPPVEPIIVTMDKDGKRSDGK